MSYNGWANYETWVANLWLTNEPASEAFLAELAEAAGSEYELANGLEEQIQDDAAQIVGTSSMFADLLGAALSEIRYDELAAHYFEDYGPDDDDDDEEDA